jgi:peptidoglycan/xylan/chitin deacetylase (PgdA/CDA1 family)
VLAISIVFSAFTPGPTGAPSATPVGAGRAGPSSVGQALRVPWAPQVLPVPPAAADATTSAGTLPGRRGTAGRSGAGAPAPALLAGAHPVTGPGHPPLRPDPAGPFGSRRTTGTPEVALTFDDGPDPSYTPQVLAVLRRYHVHATFCLIGRSAAMFPDLVRQIHRDGHTLCNHSWDHDLRLGSRSSAYIRSNLQRTSDAIHRAAPGSSVSYYRQPGGNWTRAVVDVAAALGMSSLHWQVDPQDWRRPGAGAISTMVISRARPGAIVLLHDGGGVRRGTVTALRSILPDLTRRFRLCAFPPGTETPRRHADPLFLGSGALQADPGDGVQTGVAES